MKIISQTSNEIKIKASKELSKDEEIANDLITPFCFLAFFLWPFWALPIYLAFHFSTGIILNGFTDFSLIGVTRINCDRVETQQVDCQVSKSKFFGLVQGESTSIKFVKSAKYSTKYFTFISGITSNYYGKGNLQITNKFDESKTFESNQDSANATVNSVNSFLVSQQKSLNHISDDRTNPIILSSLAITFLFIPLILFGWYKIWLLIFRGLQFILQALAKKSIVLNNSQQSFNYIETRFILGEKKDSYKFTDVAKVDVLYSSDSYDNISYKPRIMMISGVKYILDIITDRQVAIKIAIDLNRFMGLPEEEDPVVKK